MWTNEAFWSLMMIFGGVFAIGGVIGFVLGHWVF